MKTSTKELTEVDGNITWYSSNGIKASAPTRVEEDSDQRLKNLKMKILCQTIDELLLKTDRQYKHHRSTEDRIVLKDGLLFRKKIRGAGSGKHFQVLIPNQVVDDVF